MKRLEFLEISASGGDIQNSIQLATISIYSSKLNTNYYPIKSKKGLIISTL
jgi:hypothetical protein